MVDLRGTVTTVDNNIGTGGVAGRIRGKVEEGTLQLVGQTLTAHGNIVAPDVLGLLRHKVGDLGGDVAGRDGVGTGIANPLDRKGFAYAESVAFQASLLSRTYRGG